MSRILYRAKSAEGRDVADYVEADSAAEAWDKLSTSGLRDITLLQSPDISALSNAQLPGITQQQMARLRAEIMEKPGIATALRGLIRLNRIGLLLMAGVFVYGVWRNDVLSMAFPVLAVAALLALFFWKRRALDRYHAMIKAYAQGDWAVVKKIAPYLKKATTNKLLPFDMDVRLACIAAREDGLAPALHGLQHWESALAEAPGMYAARAGAVYYAARDYDGYVRQAELAAELGRHDPSRMIDVALAHAKFGDAAKARAILDGIDRKLLTPQAGNFISLIEGLLRMRANEPRDALPHLQSATEGFMEASLKSPVSWVAFAIAGGYYAVALARTGQRDAAQKAIADVMPIIEVHGDQTLLDMLHRDVVDVAT